MASPLPRECSATELQGLWRERFDGNLPRCTHPCLQTRKRRDRAPCMFHVKTLPNYVGDCSIAANAATSQSPTKPGAGERDRTVVVSLEGFCSTIELHPQCNDFTCSVNQWWRGLDSNQRTRKRADLQSAAINHSATSPRNPTLSGFSGRTSNAATDSGNRAQRSGFPGMQL